MEFLESQIKGLKKFKKLFSNEETEKIWSQIYRQPWRLDLKRRTQQYGHYFAYRGCSTQPVEPVPDFLQDVMDEVLSEMLIREPNSVKSYMLDKERIQCIINEYTPKQVISPHIDDKRFEDTIITVSLGQTRRMAMENDKNEISFAVNDGDVIVMADEARYLWRHSILKKQEDQNNVRVSITFRWLKNLKDKYTRKELKKNF